MKFRATLVLAAALTQAACGMLGIGGGGGGNTQPVRNPAPADATPAPSNEPARPGAVAPMNPVDYRGAAPGAATAPSSSASLYTRLGGVDAIRAVVHGFVGRVGADERINAFFRGADMANLERLLTEQICVATGGPCTYTGRSMRVAHEGLNLTDDHFNALVEDLTASLNQFNVRPRERGELLSALGGMRGDIVGH